MDGICSQKQTLKSIAQSGFLDVPRRIQQGSGTLHLRTPTAPTALRPKRPQWEICSQRHFNTGSEKTAGQGSTPVQPMFFAPGQDFASVPRWWNCMGTDSLACGRATPVETVHWTVSKSRLSNPSSPNTKKNESKSNDLLSFLVGEDGFEPSKRNAADLQSVPFGHSGTPPDMKFCFV